MKIKKAVIPAAGLGTRLLPATLAQPKEMLPCGKKPTIQYVVEELKAAGVEDILFITGYAKRALEDHFDLGSLIRFENSGKSEIIKEMQTTFSNLKFFFTRQEKPIGLADAIGLAKEFVADEPFFVALGDTIIHSDEPGDYLKRLAQIHSEKSSVGTILLEEVAKIDVKKYGIIEGNKISPRVWQITNLIEKPTPEKAPSQVAVCGRYLFTSEIFKAIKKTEPGVGNEMQLTDSIRILLGEGREIWGLEIDETKERRYDIGNALTFAMAFIELCLKDREIATDLKPYLKELVKKI